MTDPHFPVVVRQPMRHLQHSIIWLAGQLDMFLVVDMLQIQQHQIGHVQQIANLVPFIVSVRIQRRMKVPAFLRFPEQFGDERRLQRGFPAGYRQSAARRTVITQVWLDFGKHFFYGHFLAFGQAPGVRVMAILALQQAALHKEDEANPRPIYRSESFQ
ncbi:hypothetical protein D3C74_313860 [compost metagenome]